VTADCNHWRDIGRPDGGHCGLHGRTCSFGVCARCPDTADAGWARRLLRAGRTKGTEGTEGGKCKHRGAVVREERCRSCCGHVQVKVYECAVHGECQLGRKLGGVRTCAGCENWRLNKVPAGVNSGMGGG
jgi:hypothetical protein